MISLFLDGSTHVILVLIAYLQKLPLSVHIEVSSLTGGLNVGQSLYLHPLFVHASSACSGETMQTHMLV